VYDPGDAPSHGPGGRRRRRESGSAISQYPRRWRSDNAGLQSPRAGWDLLTEPSLLANEVEAWRLGALAAQGAGMPLVYCAPVGGGMTHVYAIDTPSWVS